MTSEELKSILQNRQSRSLRVADSKTYKIGMNAGIFQASPKPAPDNRIPVPFIRRAIKLIIGYFAKPGNITYFGEWFAQVLTDIYDANDEEVETAAILEDALTYGAAYELHWYNQETGFEFAPIPVDQAFPIFSNSLKPKLIGFVWQRKTDDAEIATFYDDQEYQTFIKNGDDWRLDEENSGAHLYGKVPVLEAVIDRDKRNVFDPILPMLDMYDKIISMVGNEHEKFSEAILLLRDKIDNITVDENGLTDADKVAQWRILDGLGDNVNTAAAYLAKNVNDTFINNTLDRYERLMYEMLCLFNPNDDSFATGSGIAQAYKLLGFELFIANLQAYFLPFLYNRMRMIAGHAVINQEEEADGVTVKTTRNLPFNMTETAQVVALLAGGKQILSQEALLNLFPRDIVEDVAAEIDRVKAETPTFSNPFAGLE